MFTNREYSQCHHPSPSGPAQISSQVPSKSSHARPRRNFQVSRYNTDNCASIPSLHTFGTSHIPMDLEDSSKAPVRVQESQYSNACEAQTPSNSSSSPTFHKTDGMKFAIPWYYARLNPTRKTGTAHASPSQLVKFATPGM